ncbi:chemotaxis protein CheB [Rhodanobacter sp. AS-Z3]|uniref:chemotaxis protein CheB n=1 Tax=Rhodanobacter sp. AS-Z3 TaxID=3031330 RepID=UPI00247B1EE4|nr:chemotaxis protein CheB [Rhodanobacter sp. AS-Z3]WEN16560.1 chemotaxis protein CheB [Rhodanobacter sp. AS-Z3]
MSASRPLKTGTGRPEAAKASAPDARSSTLSGRFLVVGIGASAGGLDAARQLLRALPADSGMAFVLVQHLDPNHESMMVELLASHTAMAVCQAANGMQIEPNHFYVIPPGTYLAVDDGALHLSEPPVRHGGRLPFDFLLHSLGEAYRDCAVCIVLSGTGADGSIGLKTIKQNGGLVLVQEPKEAGYDGMPRNAVLTGAVDHVLLIDKMPEVLARYGKRLPAGSSMLSDAAAAPEEGSLTAIIELLRETTKHDFRLYKKGTLQRRIERRMLIAGVETHHMDEYLQLLRKDGHEAELLAKDLLINVTRFFRDTDVFDTLATTIIPDMIRAHKTDQPLRIWVPGCSTGEEAYSLTILFREAIQAEKKNIKLQIFASDADADAVTSAREGLYAETIKAEVSEERLQRFFSKDEHGYRVLPDLRGAVVFTVQDVLSDPPFSRLDMVSCRNLLIYLGADAQTKAIALFHFALKPNGVLLLGSSETAGHIDARFEVISKPARLYRRIGHSHPGELNFLLGANDDEPSRTRPAPSQSHLRQTALAELCRRSVMEAFAPAAVLINLKHECLYHLGPTGRYLQVAPGHPTHDLFSMASAGLRSKLRSAIQLANQPSGRATLENCSSGHGTNLVPFGLDVRKVASGGETFLLVCFVDERPGGVSAKSPVTPGDAPRINQLEHELEATRAELQGAIQDLEASSEEQKAINEEALSVNEESQSTNEELLTSKEELQSLNEELTALNGQLQETLEHQRTTSNDLQNVLNSTDVATIFLDTELKIRLYTPATKALFSVIPGDIGRPLADLRSLATDGELLADARTVLHKLVPIEREIESRSGVFFVRRILPYRTDNNGVEGVVITFTDITQQRHGEQSLVAAKQEAESANAAKSRFLAAASHDLRQPLQTLKLLQGLLLNTVEDAQQRKLTGRIGDALRAMSGMLNALLDINEIESGQVQPHAVSFPLVDLMERLGDEFNYHASSQGLTLHVVPCHLAIQSDPRLLEQMIRNLLANALKYTRQGRILFGCRRHKGWLSIQIWDTGPGIPPEQLQPIFEEFHQLDNPARERSRGQGLGLSIVQRLGNLLGHEIRVRSVVGKGSMFAIDVALAPLENAGMLPLKGASALDANGNAARHTGMILVVEDEPDLLELLGSILKGRGHQVALAADGIAALDWIAKGGVQPDLILTDHNLPRGMTGLQLIIKLREKLGRDIPAIVLTGDISTRTSREVALAHCTQLNKPAKLKEVTYVIQRLLASAQPRSTLRRVDSNLTDIESDEPSGPSLIYVVDDDGVVRKTLREVLEAAGHLVKDFPSCEAFLDAYKPGLGCCLLVDANFPGMKGIALLRHLRDLGNKVPTIVITGSSDISLAVDAMKAGATDFIQKPFERTDLLESIARAMDHTRDANKLAAWQHAAFDHIADLTPRQKQIMDLVLTGQPSKNIAVDLGISQRTVENHRAQIMKRTGSTSIPALARLAVAASTEDAALPPPVS